MFYISIILTIIANLLYHFFQKSISSDVNPIISLIVTYTTALILSFILLPFFPSSHSFIDSFKQINWASFALAIAIILLELGFLLVYRAHWNLSLAAITSNVTVTMLLVPLGIFLFRENITWLNIVGIGFCIIGLVLANWK